MLLKRSSMRSGNLVLGVVAALMLWTCVLSASEDGQTGRSSEEVPGAEGTGENTEEAKEQTERPQVSFVPQLSANIIHPERPKNVSWVIMLYAPWCAYSQSAEPVFLDLMQAILDANVTDVYAGKVDIAREREVAQYFRVTSTPTIVFIKKESEHVYEFQEEVTIDNLKTFMFTAMSPEVTLVNTSADLADVQKVHPVVFVLIHDTAVDQTWQAIFTEVARDRLLVAKFVYTTDPDILKGRHLPSLPGIVALKDNTEYKFQDALSRHTLLTWINNEKLPAFSHVNASTFGHYLAIQGRMKMMVLVCVSDEASERGIAQRKAVEAVKKAAYSRRQNQNFWFYQLESIDVTEKIVQMSPVELPLVLAYDPKTGQYYKYEQSGEEKGFTEKSILAFLTAVNENKISPSGGGPSYINIVHNLRITVYVIIMNMITQRPYLTAAAIFSVLMLLGFYCVVYCQRAPQKPTHLSRNAAGKLRRARDRKVQGPLRQRKVHNGRAEGNKDEKDDKGGKEEKENKGEHEDKEDKGGHEEKEEEEVKEEEKDQDETNDEVESEETESDYKHEIHKKNN